MVVRIAGVALPEEKRVEIALTYIFGIGRSMSNVILHEVQINPDLRVKDLTEGDIIRLRNAIEKKMKVEGELKRELSYNIKRLKEIGSYRGDRHAKKLPTRGQRTRTNARTKRGRRVTVGSGRRKAPDKT